MTRRIIEEIDIGNTVICDRCSKDYTNSDEKGGILFGSYGYCPKCADEMLPKIRSYGEEGHIKSVCPKDMSYKDWILELRGGNNKITTYEFDSIKDLIN